MARIVFMGTPAFAVPSLQRLIETQDVVGVVTQPDRPAGRGQQLRMSPVKEAALSAEIPLYQPKSLRKEAAAEPLRAWQPDVIVVAAFGQILRPHVLDLPPHGCLNVHASLLPRWRGASPIQHAIMAGDAESGITLMRMDVGLDTGPMLAKARVAIAADETAETLHDKLAALGADLLADNLEAILAGEITAEPQDDALSTYAPMISKADGKLDWSTSAEALDRHVRAMTPWPGAFTSWNGKLLKVLSAHPLTGRTPSGQPGQVMAIEDGVAVVTAEGALALDRVQLAGKKASDAADFVRGRPEFVNSVLGDSAE